MSFAVKAVAPDGDRPCYGREVAMEESTAVVTRVQMTQQPRKHFLHTHTHTHIVTPLSLSLLQ